MDRNTLDTLVAPNFEKEEVEPHILVGSTQLHHRMEDGDLVDNVHVEDVHEIGHLGLNHEEISIDLCDDRGKLEVFDVDVHSSGGQTYCLDLENLHSKVHRDAIWGASHSPNKWMGWRHWGTHF